MADNVKYSSPDGGQTKYIENQRVADDLKKLKKPVNAVAGKLSGDRSKRMTKNKQYVERKRSSTPTKRTTAGNTTQPASRPQNVQGPLMQNGSYGNAPATPPAQTFAQNGMQRGAPPQPQYNPLPNYNMQSQFRQAQMPPSYNPLPQNRPSIFSQTPAGMQYPNMGESVQMYPPHMSNGQPIPMQPQMNPVSNGAFGVGQWLGNQYNKWGRGW